MACSPAKSAFDDLPPSAKLVYRILAYEDELTGKEISEQTHFADRTVRYALSRLGKEGLVEERVNFQDVRQKLYSIPE